MNIWEGLYIVLFTAVLLFIIQWTHTHTPTHTPTHTQTNTHTHTPTHTHIYIYIHRWMIGLWKDYTFRPHYSIIVGSQSPKHTQSSNWLFGYLRTNQWRINKVILSVVIVSQKLLVQIKSIFIYFKQVRIWRLPLKTNVLFLKNIQALQ